MLTRFLAFFVAICLHGFLVDCIREINHESVLNFNKYHKEHVNKIKIVNYIHKNGDGLKITQMPVKNFMINPNSDWEAKAIWIGDNYNQTG
jgi:hypothetical protein